MDQAGIIRDLLSWLEKNLDHPLSLDNVATKSGYSKWHLQRMFKDITGKPSALTSKSEGCPKPPCTPPRCSRITCRRKCQQASGLVWAYLTLS